MKRIARWSTIFLLLCSIIWAGTASAAMIVGWKCIAMISSSTLAMPGWALLSRDTVQPVQEPDTTGQGLGAGAAGERNRRWHVGQYGLE